MLAHIVVVQESFFFNFVNCYSIACLFPACKSMSASKRPKRQCKFQNEWLKSFDYIQKSELGNHYAYCTYCKCDVNITAGGTNDITRHSKGKKHSEHKKAVKTSFSMSNYVALGEAEVEKVSMM